MSEANLLDLNAQETVNALIIARWNWPVTSLVTLEQIKRIISHTQTNESDEVLWTMKANGKLSVKSAYHALLSTYAKLMENFGINVAFPSNVLEFINDFLENGQLYLGSKEAGVFWKNLVSAVLWTVWLEIRNRIFEDKRSKWTEMMDLAIFRAAMWSNQLPVFKNYSISEICSWNNICNI